MKPNQTSTNFRSEENWRSWRGESTLQWIAPQHCADSAFAGIREKPRSRFLPGMCAFYSMGDKPLR
jgi:hypothetical protein